MNISKHDTLIIKFTLIKVFIPSMNIHLLYNKHSIMRSSHCLMEYLKQDTYKDNTRTIFQHLTKFLLTEHSNTTRSSHWSFTRKSYSLFLFSLDIAKLEYKKFTWAQASSGVLVATQNMVDRSSRWTDRCSRWCRSAGPRWVVCPLPAPPSRIKRGLYKQGFLLECL